MPADNPILCDPDSPLSSPSCEFNSSSSVSEVVVIVTSVTSSITICDESLYSTIYDSNVGILYTLHCGVHSALSYDNPFGKYCVKSLGSNPCSTIPFDTTSRLDHPVSNCQSVSSTYC